MSESAARGPLLLLEAVDHPRTLAAITGLLLRRGHHPRSLHAEPAGTDRLVVRIDLGPDVHRVDLLARQCERLLEVLQARGIRPEHLGRSGPMPWHSPRRR